MQVPTVNLSVLHIAITQTRPHVQSSLCRSTQFTPSIKITVSHSYRPASCIVGVDWLKVWVQLVVRGRDGECRDVQLVVRGRDGECRDVQLVVRGRDGECRDVQLVVRGRDGECRDVQLSRVCIT